MSLWLSHLKQKFLTLDLKPQPVQGETQYQKAKTHIEKKQYNQAQTILENLLAHNPNHTRALTDLIKILIKKSHFKKACQHAAHLLSLIPDDFDILIKYAYALVYTHQQRKALKYIKRALMLKPEDESAQFFLQSLSVSSSTIPTIQQAPKVYILNLFDSYAECFEDSLINKLNYQTPEILYQTLLKNTKISFSRALDLGCGTGLMGEKLKQKPLVHSLFGVDLSPNMLAIAQKKQIYTQLYCSDIIEYLIENTQSFDLIIAADTLIYFGELNTIFSLVYESLNPGGFFCFSAEFSRHSHFRLQPSRRYTHHLTYLQKLQVKLGFRAIQYDNKVGRYELGKPVNMHIIIWQKLR